MKLYCIAPFRFAEIVLTSSPVFSPSRHLDFLVHFLMVALLLAAAGCSERDQSYFPLHAGWRWFYDIEMITMEGPRHMKLVLENLPRTTLEGQSVTPRLAADGSLYYYRENNGGTARIAERPAGRDTRVLTIPQPVLPADLKQGTTWSGRAHTLTLERTGPPEGSLNRIEVELPIEYVIESADDSVKVPAGNFSHCLRIRGNGVSKQNVGFFIGWTEIRIESTEWYAPGVGLVKAARRETTTSSNIPGGEYVMQLTALER